MNNHKKVAHFLSTLGLSLQKVTPVVMMAVCATALVLSGCGGGDTPTPSAGSPVVSSPSESPEASESPSPVSSSGSTDPKVKRVEDQLKEKLTQGIGADTTVTCPESAKLGADFDCSATAEDKTFEVAVTNSKESGAFEFNTKGLLRLTPLEDQIESTIKEKNKIDVTADCSEGAGDKVKIVKAGETFVCKVKTPSGETKDATVNVEDEKGNVKWKV